MVNKILVANRGEIAIRVIRACGGRGIPSLRVKVDEKEHRFGRNARHEVGRVSLRKGFD